MMEYPEGATPLNPDELAGLKFKHVQTRGQLDHLEQANIQNGLAWMHQTKHKNIISEIFARELHVRLFGEVWNWAGGFELGSMNERRAQYIHALKAADRGDYQPLFLFSGNSFDS